jgi:hypothetical protein
MTSEAKVRRTMIVKTWLTPAVSALALAGMLMVPEANAQAPAAGAPAAARRPAGGGFTQPDPIAFDDNTGWTQIFDGKSLKDWDGPSDVWHYEEGAIVGESSAEHPSGTTNIIWRGGEVANFKLKLEMKLEGAGANGGVQYRSLIVPFTPRVIPPERLAAMTDAQKEAMQKQQEIAKSHAKWNMKGYQADFDYGNRYTGQLYEQDSPRGIVAWRGQAVETIPGKPHRLLGSVGNPDELKAFIKPGEWNQVEIIADGHTLTHIINGHVMSILVDTDPAYSQAKGLIAFEIEGGGTLKISHRNVWLQKLP